MQSRFVNIPAWREEAKMDLRELLHSFFDRKIAGPLHDELSRLRQDVDRLIARIEGKDVAAPTPTPEPAPEPASIEVPVVEPIEAEAPSGEEAEA